MLLLWVAIAAVLSLVGYKWYQIYRLMASREPTPPKFWTVTIWPWAALFLIFGASIVWALADLLIHGR